MDFEDQLAANGCTLKPAEFRRIVLDTFAEEGDYQRFKARREAEIEARLAPLKAAFLEMIKAGR